MSNYPGGIDQFTRKVDNQDTILADDVNELQEAIENIETELGTDPAGSADTVAERLDDIEAQFITLTVSDTHVDLSPDNAGSHATLDEHVKDLDIHAPLSGISYNYPDMLSRTLDEMLRGSLTSGCPAGAVPTATTTAYVLDKGDTVFCNTTANPTGSGYQWLMVTAGTSSLASGGSLRLNDEAAAPVFSDSSWITRLEYDTSFAQGYAGAIDITAGDLIFAHPTANPSTSSYSWFMATANASTSSEIRLNNQASAPTFATGSQVSTFKPTATAPVSDSNMHIAAGDVVFCNTSQNPTGSDYAWRLVTTGVTDGVASTSLRLNDSGAAPTFVAGSQFSKFPTTQTAPWNDTAMPIHQGDLAFCNRTNDSPTGYTWHMVTTGSLGVSSSALRLDNTANAPVYPDNSRFTRLTLDTYQGVAQGGEILEIVSVPDWVMLNSVGTGTDPDATGTAPPIYGTISPKFPLPISGDDSEFTSTALALLNFGDPGTSTAFRPRVPAYSGAVDAYYPEVGMQIQLNSGAGSDALRGIQGYGILNRPVFGEVCGDNPTIKAYTPKLASSQAWLCYMPVVARVLDNADNSQLDMGEFVILLLASRGESDSPFVATSDDDSNAVDIFKIPGTDPYTGTGEDGELVVDGTYAENSTDGFAHPSGQLSKPGNLALDEFGSGVLVSGTTYYYRVAAVDTHGNTTDTNEVSHQMSLGGRGLKLTWDAVTDASCYYIYGRADDSEKLMKSIPAGTTEYVDDGQTDTPDPGKPYPTVNTTDRTYYIDTVKNYTNVTVQNGGVITCRTWDNASKSFGKIVFYATGTVLVDNTSKITASGKGYQGGTAYSGPHSYQGESYTGLGALDVPTNNAGGGGATQRGAGGGYGTQGSTYTAEVYGGSTYGSPTLDVLFRGSGGGGYYHTYYNHYHQGGNGGGIIFISANTIVVQGQGTIEANGDYHTYTEATVAGGSGGSIYLRAHNLDTGVGRVQAKGGGADVPTSNKGGDGRIRLDYQERGVSDSSPPAYKHQL